MLEAVSHGDGMTNHVINKKSTINDLEKKNASNFLNIFPVQNQSRVKSQYYESQMNICRCCKSRTWLERHL